MPRTSCALAQELQPRAAARRVALGGADDGEPPLSLHSARGKQSAASRDDVALDCSDWRCCGALACSESAGAVSQRRVNLTVVVVLLLFAFIYWTVVFVAVRAYSRFACARSRRLTLWAATVATDAAMAGGQCAGRDARGHIHADDRGRTRDVPVRRLHGPGQARRVLVVRWHALQTLTVLQRAAQLGARRGGRGVCGGEDGAPPAWLRVCSALACSG